MRGVLAMAATALVAAGCGLSPEPEPGPPDCSPCAAETAALRDVVADIDSVRRVITVRYVTKRGITRLPGVRMELVIERGAESSVARAVAEAGWRSRVAPLNVINIVSITPRGDDPETTTVFYDGREVDAYEAAWGPRPPR